MLFTAILQPTEQSILAITKWVLAGTLEKVNSVFGLELSQPLPVTVIEEATPGRETLVGQAPFSAGGLLSLNLIN